MMKRYGVQIPFAGHFYVEVEAESVDEAKRLALNENPFDEKSDAEIEEVEYYMQMNQGNISYCTLSEISVEEI